MLFTGKVAVITGGARGIGAETVLRLVKEGLIVYVLDIFPLSYSLQNLHFIKCDVTSFQEVQAAIKQVFDLEQRIDYAFLNAGIHYIANIEDTSLEKIDEIINTNLKGVLYVLKNVLPVMRKQLFGAIVLTGSDQTFSGKIENAVYGLTKGAIGQLTKSLALDYAKYNIRVNCVCPGSTDTLMLNNAIKTVAEKLKISRDETARMFAKEIPLNRLGKTEEIANVVTFLFSDEASYVTGALWAVDGGYTA